MSPTTAGLRRKITSAEDLQSIVRTMKTMAASSIGQYEQAVLALTDDHRTVEIGLGACLRRSGPLLDAGGAPSGEPTAPRRTAAIIFGSDQGLVGQFDEVVTEFAVRTLSEIPGDLQIWAEGERIHARLEDAGLAPRNVFALPGSVAGIAPLIGRIQLETEEHREPVIHGHRRDAARRFLKIGSSR